MRWRYFFRNRLGEGGIGNDPRMEDCYPKSRYAKLSQNLCSRHLALFPPLAIFFSQIFNVILSIDYFRHYFSTVLQICKKNVPKSFCYLIEIQFGMKFGNVWGKSQKFRRFNSPMNFNASANFSSRDCSRLSLYISCKYRYFPLSPSFLREFVLQQFRI